MHSFHLSGLEASSFLKMIYSQTLINKYSWYTIKNRWQRYKQASLFEK